MYGEGGPQDTVLQNSGRVMLKLGPDIQSESIGDKGQAYFPAIPADFRGHEVPAWVESDTYESVSPSAKLDGTSLDLQVKKKIKHYKLAGAVSGEAGSPLPGVRIMLQGLNAVDVTKDDGSFSFDVAADSQRSVDLVAQKQGYQMAHLSPTLGDSSVDFSMKRNR